VLGTPWSARVAPLCPQVNKEASPGQVACTTTSGGELDSSAAQAPALGPSEAGSRVSDELGTPESSPPTPGADSTRIGNSRLRLWAE